MLLNVILASKVSLTVVSELFIAAGTVEARLIFDNEEMFSFDVD